MEDENVIESWIAFEDKFEGWRVKVEQERSTIGTLFVAKEIQQGFDEGKRHAKLIAAAPDLLLALNKVLANTGWRHIGAEALTEAKAAIEKATS